MTQRRFDNSASNFGVNPQRTNHEACGSCKGWTVSRGNVDAGLTCCELSGEVFVEFGGLGVTDRETIYRSVYELKRRRFQYALEGSPTLASEDFSVGLSPYFARSSGMSKSSVRTSNRLLPRGIFFFVTRMKGRSESRKGGLC
jgi:hypothetical protein